MENNSLEKLVEELKAVIPFKETTAAGDIVLILAHNPQMLIYAVVTDIERDQNKRDEWWNIKLTFLTVPMQKVVWTLRTAQMTGQEIFTMGGEKRFFKAVETGLEAVDPQQRQTKAAAPLHPESKEKKSPLKRIK